MDSSDTLLGSDFRLLIGDGNSPEGFVDACSIGDVAGLGESKSQVEVTTYCDDAKAFIGGLREGQEVTLTANFIPGATDVAALFAGWDSGSNMSFRFAMKSSPDTVYLQWSGALLSWAFLPPVGDKASLTFTVKISGGVTRSGFDG
ncbi:MAG: hypothetical protein ABI661_04950 [Gammaproteobacteria bacterium]